MRDDGGIYTKAYSAVFYKPFTEKTGIEVVGVQAAAEPVAQIKGMVDTKTYTWDMAKISLPAIYILTTGDKKYLETHGLESEPVVKSIPAQYMSPYGVGTNIYSTVLAYRNDKFKGASAPPRWADLWNVKEVPGRRALRKHPFDTIEESLMADGVPAAQVYPCNLERAFASLDKIKPHVGVWWTYGAQCEQMLTSGEVDMIADLGVARRRRRSPTARRSASSGTRTSGAPTTGRSSPARPTRTPAASSSSSPPTRSAWPRWSSTSRPASRSRRRSTTSRPMSPRTARPSRPT